MMEVAPPHTVGSEADIATVVNARLFSRALFGENCVRPKPSKCSHNAPLTAHRYLRTPASDAYLGFAIMFPAADHARRRRHRTGRAAQRCAR